MRFSQRLSCSTSGIRLQLALRLAIDRCVPKTIGDGAEDHRAKQSKPIAVIEQDSFRHTEGFNG